MSGSNFKTIYSTYFKLGLYLYNRRQRLKRATKHQLNAIAVPSPISEVKDNTRWRQHFLTFSFPTSRRSACIIIYIIYGFAVGLPRYEVHPPLGHDILPGIAVASHSAASLSKDPPGMQKGNPVLAPKRTHSMLVLCTLRFVFYRAAISVISKPTSLATTSRMFLGSTVVQSVL